MADLIGQRLGNYRLLRLIGRGGFADVYQAEHVHLGTQAAIKVLQVRLVESNKENFLNEARTIAHLVHPYIIRVLDFGVENEIPFLVMDYAPGGTFRQRYLQGKPLPAIPLVSFIKQAAAALQYGHDKKLIHRDVKPENMLLGPNDEILLSDFGFALIAHNSISSMPTETAGTAAYMAPEQLQGKSGPASDQYSLGIIAYEWLSGSCPFQGSFFEVASQQVFTPPPSLSEKVPEMAPEIVKVVMTALEKDPQLRFPTVRDFALALEEACLNSKQYAFNLSIDQQLSPAQSSKSGVSFSKGTKQDRLPSQSDTTYPQHAPANSVKDAYKRSSMEPATTEPVKPQSGTSHNRRASGTQHAPMSRIRPLANTKMETEQERLLSALTHRSASRVKLLPSEDAVDSWPSFTGAPIPQPGPDHPSLSAEYGFSMDMQPMQASPSLNPMQSSPSLNPMQSSPSLNPMQSSPSLNPMQASPSLNPMQASPSLNPMQASPSLNPIQSSPFLNPRQSSPSLNPRQSSPSLNPIQSSPSLNPIQSSPSLNPIQSSPSLNPIQSSPSLNPIQSSPSLNPMQAQLQSINKGKSAFKEPSSSSPMLHQGYRQPEISTPSTLLIKAQMYARKPPQVEGPSAPITREEPLRLEHSQRDMQDLAAPIYLRPARYKIGGRDEILLISLLILLVVGVAAGFYSYSTNNVKQNTVQTASLAKKKPTAQPAKPIATPSRILNTANPYSPYSGTYVLNEPLTSNNYGWQESTATTIGGSCKFVEGGYQDYNPIIDPNPCFATSTNFTDFTYQVDMQFTAIGQLHSGGGIVFRGNSTTNNYYYFEVYNSGKYSLQVCNAGNCTIQLAGYKFSNQALYAFHPGLNVTNTLAVVANGSKFDLYVNNQFIQEVVDPNNTYTAGMIGVLATGGNNDNLSTVATSTPGQVLFSNAKVWKM